ncbi:alpha/beta hydrolase [Cognatishimia sp. F0-27]|uniref:alpha/beta hydrolase n=1 Tax=Cognatishimia sp. F0-27 TaxID=2816855 RepID=UPI001D0CBE9E|nr:alpha/beta hydrolase [Cognatishimia sp. F0-27]MCC1494078.1 alpha/beta hydrolase [Cognatishimia sp. F0-27]
MPMIAIEATSGTPRLHGQATGLGQALHRALRADPGPITVMIHGYKYQPGNPDHCPFNAILALSPERVGKRIVSWPKRLGLRGQYGEGLGIAFGWQARGSVWRAYDEAHTAGTVLGELLHRLHKMAPDRPVRLVAHSMGARVALRALCLAPQRQTSTVILMAAAEYAHAAETALHSPGGRGCQVLNVTSRENDLFDFMLERTVRAPRRGDPVLGRVVQDPTRLPGLTTLQIDHPETLDVLRRAGYPLALPERRICHWSPYLRVGIFPLYRAVLAGRLDPATLAPHLPDRTESRWSRFSPRPIWPANRAFPANRV